MRRKVLQDFANVFCQRIIDLPEGYDLASFAHYGSGKYSLNVLTLADRLEGCEIDKGPRGQGKRSDHTPIIVTLSDST